MPRIIISARNYPFSLLLGGLLFALTLFLTTQSMGKVNGAGGDDEGSGLGGTGKSGEFGGSGLGGTGAPNPFLGLNEDLEQARQELEQAREELKPLLVEPALDRLIRLDTLREQATSLAETSIIPDNNIDNSTQVDLSRLPGSGNINRSPGPRIEVPLPNPVPTPAQLHEMLTAESGARAIMLESELEQAAGTSPDTDNSASDQTPNQETMTELAGVDTSDEKPDLAETDSDPDQPSSDERIQAPERIQRPELPPFQRMRPAIDRSAIVPARPQPMRI